MTDKIQNIIDSMKVRIDETKEGMSDSIEVEAKKMKSLVDEMDSHFDIKSEEGLNQYSNKMTESIENCAKNMIRTSFNTIKSIQDRSQKVVNTLIENSLNSIDGIHDKVEEIKEDIINSSSDAAAHIKSSELAIIKDIVGDLKSDAISKTIDEIMESCESTISDLIANTEHKVEELKREEESAIEYIKNITNSKDSKVQQIISDTNEKVKSAIGEIYDFAENMLGSDKAYEFMCEISGVDDILVEQVLQSRSTRKLMSAPVLLAPRGLLSGIKNGLSNMVDKVTDGAKSIANKVADTAKEVASSAIEKAKDVASDVANKVADVANKAKEAAKDVAKNIGNAALEAGKKALDKAGELAGNALDAAKEAMQPALDAVTGIAKDAIDAVSDMIPEPAKDLAKHVAKKVGDAVNNAVDKAKDIANDLYNKAKDKVKDLLGIPKDEPEQDEDAEDTADETEDDVDDMGDEIPGMLHLPYDWIDSEPYEFPEPDEEPDDGPEFPDEDGDGIPDDPKDSSTPTFPTGDATQDNTGMKTRAETQPSYGWDGVDPKVEDAHGILGMLHDGDQQLFNPYGHYMGTWTTYSFRPSDAKKNYPQISIIPASFQVLESIDKLLDQIPYVVVKEFFFKNTASTMIKMLEKIMGKAKEAYSNLFENNDDATDTSPQTSSQGQGDAKSVGETMMEKIKGVFQDIEPRLQVIELPYLLYCCLRQKVYGNIYVFPYIVDPGGGTPINQAGNQDEWDKSNNFIQQIVSNAVDAVGGAIQNIVGTSARPTANLFPSPTWGGQKGEAAKFEFELILINDHVVKARNNYMCVNTIIHNNRSIQKAILDHPGALYELWLPTGQRHLMCSCNLTLSPLGLNRRTPAGFFDGGGVPGADFSIGTTVATGASSDKGGGSPGSGSGGASGGNGAPSAPAGLPSASGVPSAAGAAGAAAAAAGMLGKGIGDYAGMAQQAMGAAQAAGIAPGAGGDAPASGVPSTTAGTAAPGADGGQSPSSPAPVSSGMTSKMQMPHVDGMEVVPDAYKLKLDFKSCLPNNMNTSVFQYYVKMSSYEETGVKESPRESPDPMDAWSDMQEELLPPETPAAIPGTDAGTTPAVSKSEQFKRQLKAAINRLIEENPQEKFEESTYNKKLGRLKTNYGDLGMNSDSVIYVMRRTTGEMRRTNEFLSKLYDAENNNLWFKPFAKDEYYTTLEPDYQKTLRNKYKEQYREISKLDALIARKQSQINKNEDELTNSITLDDRQSKIAYKVRLDNEFNELKSKRDALVDQILQISTDMVQAAFDAHDDTVSVKKNQITTSIIQQVWNEKIMNSYEKDKIQYMTSQEKTIYFNDKIREMRKFDVDGILNKEDWFFRIVVMDYIVNEMQRLVTWFKDCSFDDFETIYKIVRKLNLLHLDLQHVKKDQVFNVNETNLFFVSEQDIKNFTKIDDLLNGNTLYELFSSQMKISMVDVSVADEEEVETISEDEKKTLVVEQATEVDYQEKRKVRQEVVNSKWQGESGLTRAAFSAIYEDEYKDDIVKVLDDDNQNVIFTGTLSELKEKIVELKLKNKSDEQSLLQSLLGAFTNHISWLKEQLVMNEMGRIQNEQETVSKEQDNDVLAKVTK